jgi:hypothetical protein
MKDDPYAWLKTFFPGKFTLQGRLSPRSPARAREFKSRRGSAKSRRFDPPPKGPLSLDKRITLTKPHYRSFSFRREDLDAWLAQYRTNVRGNFRP